MCFPAIAKRRYLRESGTNLVPISPPPSLPSLAPPFSVLGLSSIHSFACVGAARDVNPGFSSATKSHRRSGKQQDANWNSLTRAGKLISVCVSGARVFVFLRTPLITRARIRQAALSMTRRQLLRKILMQLA